MICIEIHADLVSATQAWLIIVHKGFVTEWSMLMGHPICRSQAII